jgi:uncharacterized protein (DUF2267 family)
MEKQDQWLQRVLGVTLSGGPAASDDDEELDVAALTDWLDDIEAQAAALPKQVRADLLARAKQARPKLQPDTIKEAAAELMALTTEIADAARTARVEQATAESGTVVYQALVRQWQEAQDAAHTRLDGFVARLLADPELQEDPRFPNLQQAAGQLGALIPSDGGQLQQALLALGSSSGPTESAAAREDAAAAIDSYRNSLTVQTDLETLQQVADEAYDGTPFLKSLLLSLDDLGAKLKRAA